MIWQPQAPNDDDGGDGDEDNRAKPQFSAPGFAFAAAPDKGGMAPRPVLQPGDYVLTRSWGKSRCKAYDAPPLDGRYITTIDQGTMLGPISSVLSTPFGVTVCVRDYWITVWRANNGATFADKVPDSTMLAYRRRGWQDQ